MARFPGKRWRTSRSTLHDNARCRCVRNREAYYWCLHYSFVLPAGAASRTTEAVRQEQAPPQVDPSLEGGGKVDILGELRVEPHGPRRHPGNGSRIKGYR